MALIQKGTRITFTGTATPSVTFSTQNLASGSTLQSYAGWEQPLATLNSVADGANGAYTQLPVGNSGNNGSAGDGACRIGYFLTNSSTGKPTVTFTFSSGVDGVINCYENPAQTLDQHAENGGASSSAGVTIVGAAGNAFLLAGTHRRFGGAGVDAGISGVSDFMDLNVNSGQHSVQYSNNAGSAGNKQVDFNDTTSQPAWATAAATFVAAGGGGGNTIAVPAGSLTLSAQTPTVVTTANNQIAVPLATLTLAAQTPIVIATANQIIAVPAGSLTLTGFAPSVLNGVTIAVPAGALTLTGLAPTVLSTANNVINVPLAALALTGFAPVVIGDPVVASSNPGAPAGGSARFEFSKKILKTKRAKRAIDIHESPSVHKVFPPALAKSLASDLLSKLEDEPEDEEVLAMLLADEENAISMLITSISQGL